MPTTLPRTTLTWRDHDVYEDLANLAKERKQPLADMVMEIIISAANFLEDAELFRIGSERLKTFKREEALTTDELLAWNRTRKI